MMKRRKLLTTVLSAPVAAAIGIIPDEAKAKPKPKRYIYNYNSKSFILVVDNNSFEDCYPMQIVNRDDINKVKIIDNTITKFSQV